MEYLSEKRFSFTSQALPEETFGVVSFTGTEGISRCYRFDITLVSDNLEVDFAQVVRQGGTFTFFRKDGSTVEYHGLVLRFEQLNEVDGVAFYRAHLLPRLFCLGYTRHNQVFLEKTIQEMVTECLEDGGLTARNFEFRLEGIYESMDYVCQYGESHLAFVSRWLEHEGIYYFFEQTPEGEKVIFTDTMISHTPMPQGDTLSYAPPSGLEAGVMDEVVRSFNCSYRLTPAAIMLKDYNYMKPSLEVTGTADVDPSGRGRIYSYGDHIRSPEEGDRLAGLRSEALIARREIYEGEGSVPYVSPGYTFTLENHYRKGFNRSYLVTEVSHEGNQTGYLLAGLTPEAEGKLYYRNSFHAIPASVQFRPEVKTERPRISGFIPAKIDGEGSGEYAEVDGYGRYKVILPFDTSGRKDGKASQWLRKVTPYAGSNHGMHLPLHKGTEVAIAFVDGDVDRPIIVGAVPNPDTPSPITTDNQTMAMIHTGGGNKISIQDREGSQHVLLHSPTQNSSIRLGASDSSTTSSTPSDSSGSSESQSTNTADWKGRSMAEDTGKYGIHLFTNGLIDVEAATKNEVTLGESVEIVMGLTSETHIGESMSVDAIAKQEYSSLYWEHSADKTEMDTMKNEIHELKESAVHFENQFHVNRNIVHDIENRVGQVATSVRESRNEITQAYTRAIAQQTAALATKDEVAAAKNEAIAQTNRAVAQVTETTAEAVRTVATSVAVVAQKTTTIGSQVKTAAQVTQSIASKTNCGAEKTELAALITMM